MRLSKQLKYRLLNSPVVISGLYYLIHLYCRTLRLSVENEAHWQQHVRDGGKVLLCAWHQQFFAVIRHFQTYREFTPSILISQSRDGEIIAGVAARSGWRPVRGSSSRGARQGFRQMIESLRGGNLAVMIVDGPRGPAGRVKPGAIRLAHATNSVLVPFYVSADRAWQFNSWDRFFVPKPFARVTLRFDHAIRLDPARHKDDFERQRLLVEQRMVRELHP